MTESFPGERIAKVIARAGAASRRDAERLIAAGRVAVNGATIDLSGATTTSAPPRLLKAFVEPVPARDHRQSGPQRDR